MKSNEIKKFIKPLVYLFGAAIVGGGVGELTHLGKEAKTRKKAMDAAVRKHNQAVVKKEETT